MSFHFKSRGNSDFFSFSEMKALDKDQVDSKMMKNEKILKPTKRSKKFWSPGGLLAGICILTGKKSSQKMKNLT